VFPGARIEEKKTMRPHAGRVDAAFTLPRFRRPRGSGALDPDPGGLCRSLRAVSPAVRVLALAAGLALLPAGIAGLQEEAGPSGEARAGTPTVRVLQAQRLQGPAPVIDGDLSDSAWESAPVATGFVQMLPDPGRPASERTEARVLYDDEAVYVAVRAWDSRPDSIAGQLTRRGESSYSDVVWVMIDSFFDRRTAFRFKVNPVGVKSDDYFYDDVRQDAGWEAVWDVATRVDSSGWSAEFRIPLSQLRFSGAAVQSWGINFGRDIARRNETVTWAPLNPGEQAVVSRAGILEGIRDLSPGSRIELMPYTAGRVERAPGDPANPYWKPTDGAVRAGADLRVGVTNDLTLDVTVNPDFGQVEADPAEVNLSAFETFFPERRPFFQEGAGIFRMGIGLGDGDGENQGLFYSRRIGRAPQGRPPSGAEWADAPTRSRILGAAKLSGKTRSGWSVGLLSAATDAERARARVDGEEVTTTVEPRTGYSVARLQKDFRGGGTSIGGIATATLRDAAPADALALHRRAWSGGVDLRHRLEGGNFEIRSFLLGSRVEGSPEALIRTQSSSARYFQRPDAGHVEVDPDATRLDGWSAKLEVMKIAGGNWRGASFTHVRSPGFEVNDLGFMPSADYLTQWFWLQRRSDRPGSHLRNWAVNLNAGSTWTFGRERTNLNGNVNLHGATLGNLQFRGGMNVNGHGRSATLLRGGPAIRTERGANGWAGFATDARRDVQLDVNGSWSVRPEADSWSMGLSPSLRWRPSGRTTLRAGPWYSHRVEDRQWVDGVTLGEAREYVFGRMEQRTLAMTVRADLALTPTLSFQLYAQPFLSSGSFGSFKRVADPGAADYRDRFQQVEAELVDGRYRADLTGDGEPESFRNPHFSSMQFRSNAVLRWEYRPGSTAYLVWAQGREAFAPDGSFDVGRRYGDLFSTRPENVLMVKVSYWMNP
jgi:hypothetical protein